MDIMSTNFKIDIKLYHCVKNNLLDDVKNIINSNPGLIKTQYRVGRNLLHISCLFDSIDVLKFIITYFDENEINQPDFYGNTPLHISYLTKNNEAILFLLSNININVNINNKNNQTAYDLEKKISKKHKKILWSDIEC